jgi:hypothetical protein
MRASPGDRIVVKGHRVGEPDRNCEVLEAAEDGGPLSGAVGRRRSRDAVLSRF